MPQLHGRPGPLAAAGLALAIVLAGCVSRGSREGDANEPKPPRLADFAGCDFAYPNGSRMQCGSASTERHPEDTDPPAGWLCREMVGDRHRGFSVHQSLVGDGWGIKYYVDPFPLAVSGVLMLATDQGVELYNWSMGGPTGFVRFPEVPTGPTDITLRTYGLRVSTNASALQNSEVELVWSLYQEEPWGTYRVQALGQSYYFSIVVSFHDSYFPASFHQEGEDFDLDVDYEKGFNALTQYRSLQATDVNCTL